MELVQQLNGTVDSPRSVFKTAQGSLYQGDCLALLPKISSESVDLVFADPPFNLGKDYPSKMNDSRNEDEYLEWCREWTTECARILKPGGSFFLFNLPRWNFALGDHLRSLLTFRHLIAVEISYRLPIQGRLYPSHYSLVYMCKGERPATFTPDRLPMETCRHCFGEIKDYGGYKDKMNPKGINLSDVWHDIPPVRHAKFKRRNGSNELSIKLLDRVIRMASREGDTVLDPFGGSGTTYAVAEIANRRWIGMEIGPTEGIVQRLSPGNLAQERRYLEEFRGELNQLFPPEIAALRRAAEMWVPGNIPKGPRRRHSELKQELMLFDEPKGKSGYRSRHIAQEKKRRKLI
jgi:site-specific DNA-methyltransferase (adenine-specific)